MQIYNCGKVTQMTKFLTKKRAIELHRQMWACMQMRLGDNPDHFERINFKKEWCDEHFPNDKILNNCFLCEYVASAFEDLSSINCKDCCPIQWTNNFCLQGEKNYSNMPISELLALPERSDES